MTPRKFSNHIYTFNGQIRKQKQGGGIGDKLTGGLAILFMIWWARTFLDKVTLAAEDIPGFVILMFKIFVDDGNLICKALPPGSRLLNGKIVIIEEEVENDSLIPSDQRTAEILLQIGNSIVDFIQLTADYPSKNESGWMPILDLQVKVSQNRIVHKFYKKPVSNPLLMLENSAMPMKVKRNSLAQEGIRRLRNCSRDLPWSEKAEILSEFSHKLMLSGYSERFRLDIIQSAVRGYQRLGL